MLLLLSDLVWPLLDASFSLSRRVSALRLSDSLRPLRATEDREALGPGALAVRRLADCTSAGSDCDVWNPLTLSEVLRARLADADRSELS